LTNIKYPMQMELDRELILLAGSIAMSDNPSFQMKYWREKLGISQTELTNKMGITVQTLWQYETGHRKVPGVKVVRRYVHALSEIARSKNMKLMPSPTI